MTSKKCVVAGCPNPTDGWSTCCAEHMKPSKEAAKA